MRRKIWTKMKNLKLTVGVAALAMLAGCASTTTATHEVEQANATRPGDTANVKNVVLVHGAFVDGSGWQAVYSKLEHDGYHVSVVQNPTTSLADDVAATQRVLAMQNGPALLVGHSYGGVVITEAGNSSNVAALVYIAAFAPDAGESVSSLIKDPPPGAPVPPILPPQNGFLMLDKSKFAASFAADVDPEVAAFRAAWSSLRSDSAHACSFGTLPSFQCGSS